MNDREEKIRHFLGVFEWLGVKLMETYHICVDPKDDLSKQEFSLVGFLGANENVIMRDIAEFLEVPFSTATGIVDKLVQKKYLKRFHSPTDRRTVMICLTPKKGKAMYERYLQKRFELGQLVMSALNQEEQDQLINILEKVTDKVGENKWGEV